MATSRTLHYQLDKLNRGGSLAANDYKILNGDRDLIDLLLWLGAEAHHHTGVVTTADVPDTPLDLLLDQDAGTLPAGTRIFYKYTLVNDQGLESTASPEAYVDTPAAVVEPGAASLAWAATGGTLLPGPYNYVLSAYKQAATLETRAINFSNVLVPAPATTNAITLTLPSVPSGADGFNVYRRKPGSTAYYWIASIDMTVFSPPETFLDDGSYADDCARTLPNANRTNSQNSIHISLPGATPAVPEGYTWKVYRSYVTGDYRNSTLHHVVEETSEGSGIIDPTYLDLGYATSAGSPPVGGVEISSPEQIVLTDGAEVQGRMAPANAIFKDFVQFTHSGAVSATTTGTFAWRCPWEQAVIESVVISLGKGSSPAAASLIVDVNKAVAGSDTFTTIFSTQANRPRILVAGHESTAAVPDTLTLEEGDRLTFDIDQIGGGATPTDSDLLVTVYLWAMDSATDTPTF
jgi:hypothetical protein